MAISGDSRQPANLPLSKEQDWREMLLRDGFVVIPGAVSRTRAQYYLDSLFDWLETFPHGFNKGDKSTWVPEHLPAHIKGGMYHGYSVSHEKFFWEARQEPASFDGVNLTLPHAGGGSNQAKPKAEFWPHVDQSPKRRGLQCVQGLLNLAPNGPQDGGLIILKGSSALNEAFFASRADADQRKTWGPSDWFGFTADELEWFLERGCEGIKVCADPGDLILWDSRTVHYNKPPESDNIRSVLYMCFTPAEKAAAKDLDKKKELFYQPVGTTHWPHDNIFPNNLPQMRLGQPDTYRRARPWTEPEETEKVLRLAGALPYV